MDGEVAVSIRTVLTLIVIGVLLTLVNSIMGFARASTAERTTTIQNSVDALSEVEFGDYNQRVLSGARVISVIKQFETRPVATVTRTIAIMGTGSVKSDKGYNYGAVLEGTSDVTADSEASRVTAPLVKSGNNSWYTAKLAANVPGNKDYLPLTAEGKSHYVRPNGKFKAELIKDPSGTIIGVCFTQL